MYKVIFILDKFFLKYKEGKYKQIDPPQKINLKKPSVISVNAFNSGIFKKNQQKANDSEY